MKNFLTRSPIRLWLFYLKTSLARFEEFSMFPAFVNAEFDEIEYGPDGAKHSFSSPSETVLFP
jgi:hypothetical protein